MLWWPALQNEALPTAPASTASLSIAAHFVVALEVEESAALRPFPWPLVLTSKTSPSAGCHTPTCVGLERLIA